MPRLSEQLTEQRKEDSQGYQSGRSGVALFAHRHTFFWSRRLDRLSEEALALQSEVDKLAARTEEKLVELQSWQLTQTDLAEIKENSFYAGQAGIEIFRQDLKSGFSKSRFALTTYKLSV